MTVKINPAKIPDPIFEQSIRELADSGLKAKLAQEAKLKIDNEIAEEAFLIAQRHELRHGDETLDLPDQKSAPVTAESNLRTHYFDRRNPVKNERRHETAKDRRSH